MAYGLPDQGLKLDVRHGSEEMIEHKLDGVHSILYVRPRSKLEQADFEQLAATVNPHIEERGALAGLIIEVAVFPGWDSLGAMASHFRFVRDHHKHIKKVGVVSDSPLGAIAENLASHFVAAKIKISQRENLRPQSDGSWIALDAARWANGIEHAYQDR